MSRKAIDKQQPNECRQAIWEWIRINEHVNGPLAVFILKDIDVNLEKSSVREYLTGLANAGYLVATKGKGLAENTTYTLVKDAGHHAPRVRKDGSEVIQGKSRQYMWNIIPILKNFTTQDLAYNASTPEHTVEEVDAKDYITHLYRAGYLVMAKVCKQGEKQLWKLKHGMWTGPQPPQVQRTKQVYDPNLQRVVWAVITGGAE